MAIVEGIGMLATIYMPDGGRQSGVNTNSNCVYPPSPGWVPRTG